VIETGRMVLEGRDLIDDPRVRESFLGGLDEAAVA